MQHSLFRYFSKKEHADAFLSGQVYFRSLRYFSDYEDEQVRGDPHEGSLVHGPPTGIVINNLTQNSQQLIAGSQFKATAKQGDIFVYCLSMTLNDIIRKRFEAVVCVEIRDKREFLRLARATAESLQNKVYIGPVVYRELSEHPKDNWAKPEKVSMSKSAKFKWQDEYRLVIGKPEVFATNNVDVMLVEQNHIFEKNPEEAQRTYTLQLADISDLCRIHSFS